MAKWWNAGKRKFAGKSPAERSERAPSARPAPARRLHLSRLEPRILMSATPAAPPEEVAALVAVETIAAPAEVAAANAPAVTASNAGSTVSAMMAAAESNPAIVTSSNPTADAAASDSQSAGSTTEAAVRRELVVLDPQVDDFEMLLDRITSANDAERHIDVVLLDAQRDGIEQITEILSQYQGLDAVHVLTHGTDGALRIGDAWLRTETLALYAGMLGRWGDAFAADADLLLYGCDLAASATGRSLVESLAVLTGADVAASVDDTGHTSLGGDWQLEFATSAIESASAVSADIQSEWLGVLAPSSRGLAIWRNSADTTPNVNGWDGVSFGTSANSANVGEWRIITGADAPTRNEAIVVGVDGSGLVTGQRWNGTTWSALPFNTIVTAGSSTNQSFAVAYESQSGSAIVAWSNETDSTTSVTYRVWNGSSWSAAQTITTPISGVVRELRMASNPLNDEIMLLASTTNGDEFAVVWNGSSWGNAVTLDTSGIGDVTDAGLAYESQSGHALVVYDADGSSDPDLRYRVWDGSSWSGESILTPAAGIASGNDPNHLSLASDPNSDRIGLSVVTDTASNAVWLAVWDGSSWGSKLTATTTATSGVIASASVAFESDTGRLMAVYEHGGDSTVHYRTWTSGGGWTAQQTGPNLGSTPNVMTLTSDPATNQIMLAAQDSANDLHFIRWNGTAWGTDNELSTSTGETAVRPFLFLFDQGPSTSLSLPTIFLSTTGDTTNPGVGSFNSIDNAEVFQVSNPSLAVEPGTSGGTFAHLFDLNDFADDGNADVDAVHYVSQDIVVGTGSNTFALQSGDLLLSTDSSESLTALNSLTVSADEVFVFRPTNPGDYSSGTFHMLLDNFGSIHGGGDTWSISLVEQNTLVGDTTLQAATFLFSRQGASEHQDVRVFTPTGVGAGTTAGSVSVLINGEDLNFNAKIYGMELVETATTIEGHTIPSGAILLSLETDDSSVGSNNIAVTRYDIWYLTVTQTTLVAGTSVANATLLFQGSDVGLNSSTESLDGIAMLMQSPPVITLSGTPLNYTENSAATVIDTTASVTDADSSNFSGGTLTISFTANGTADDRLAIRHQGSGAGQIGISGANVSYSGVTIGTWSGGTSGSTPLVVTLNSNATPTAATALLRNITFANVSETPSTTARTVQFGISDGDGGISNPETATINVTAVNDLPSITSNGGGATAAVSISENTTAVTTVTATDLDLPTQTLSYSISGGADGALFTIGSSTGVLTFSSAPDFETPADADANNVYVVIVQVSDGNGGTDTQTINVTVTPVNDNAPTITSNGGGATAAINVAENTTAVTTVTAADADLPAQTLAYSIIGGADAGRFTIGASSGVLAFTSARNYEAPSDADANNIYVVTVQVSDGAGMTDTQTISVTITPVNDNAPTITSNGGGATASINVAENTTAVSTVTATDADLPAQTMTYSISGGADAALFSIDSSTGALTFAAAPDYESPADADANNVYVVIVQASDGAGLTDTQTISVTVTPTNDNAPSITSNGGGAAASINIAENVTAVTTVTATDTDLPAQTLTYSIVGGADSARFTIGSSSGALAFAVAPNYESPTDADANNVYVVTVQVSDGLGMTDTQTISVTITPTNDNAPTITSNGAGAAASVNVAENATAVTTVTATDADLPAQTLTYSISGGADAARFTIDANTGVLAFATAPDYESPADADANNVYVVTVQVSDGAGMTDSQTISVTVTPTNDNAPSITSNGGGAAASLNVAENLTAVTTVTATDADLPAQTLTYSIVGGADAARFTIDANTGALAFAVAPDFEAPADSDANNVYVVTVQVSDGAGMTDTQTISVTITPTNDNAPTITSNGGGAAAFVNVAENTTAVTTVTATDADLPAQTLTYSISGGADAGHFTIDANTGVLAFATAPDYESPADADANNVYVVTVQVSDGNGLTDAQTISVTITPANEFAPTITSNGGGAAAAVNVAENSTAVATVTATDADLPAQTLTYSITGGADAARFVIDANTGALTFAVAPNYESPIDSNGDNVYVVTVQASDGQGGTDTQTLTVTVTPTNDNAPTITSNGGGAAAAVNVAENTTAVTTVTAADADLPAQTLTYSISGGADAARFTIDANTGALAFAVAPDYEAPNDADANNVYVVVVQASDGNGLTDTQTISVTVTPVNDNAPTITSNGGGAAAAVNVVENATAVTTATATDADLPAQTLTWSITGGADAARFTIDANTGALTFVAAPDFEAPIDADTDNVYVVTIQVSDSAGSTDAQTISVTVTPANDNAPIITSDGGGAIAGLAFAENTTAVTTVAATDADLPGQTVTYSISGGADAAHFTIDANTGVLTFAAAPDYENPLDADGDNVYVVDVQASDGAGLTDVQTISVSVTPVNDNAPVITSNGGGTTAVDSIPENTTAVTTVTATDADLPGQTLTYSISGGADAGHFTIDATTGVLAFVAAPDAEAPADSDGDNVYEVTVQVSDGAGGFDTQDIAVTVQPNNDNAPVITSNGGGATANRNVAENNTAVTTVVATDADLPSQTLTYSIAGGADAARFSINANTGALAFAAAPDYELPADVDGNNVYVVVVQASDGLGGTDTQTINVNVTPVNDNNPIITSNGGGAAATINVAENVAAVTTVTATDADLPAQTLSYSISGGADAALFAIDSTTGALSFAAAPDYELPTDVDGNNVYQVTVRVSDGAGRTDTQAISVTVTPVNDNAPIITSDGGGATAGVNVLENSTAVTTVTATDADLPGQTMTYSIAGGADAAFFTIDATTGALSFAAPRDFETPADADGDNVYVVTVQASDGVGLVGMQTVEVSVTPANEPPAIAVPGAQGTNEDVPLVFSAVNGNAITLSDVDAGTGVLQVTLSSTNGTLTLGTTAGLAFSIGDGSADTTLEFTGTLASINAALEGLTYQSSQDYNGPATISVDVSDLGNTGAGVPLTDSATINVAVAAVNDPTVVTISSGSGVYVENGSPAPIDEGLTLTDVDSPVLNGAVIQIAANYEEGIDELQFEPQAGITAVWDEATGTLTLSGAASVADYQAALRSVTFVNSSENPLGEPRTVTFAIDDGFGLSPAISMAVTVIPTAEDIVAPPPPTQEVEFDSDSEQREADELVPFQNPQMMQLRRQGSQAEIAGFRGFGLKKDVDDSGDLVLALPTSFLSDSLRNANDGAWSETTEESGDGLPTVRVRVPVPDDVAGRTFDAVFLPLNEFQDQLGRIAEQGSSGMQLVTGSMAVVSVGVTIGYLVWVWKTGSLFLTAMTTFPAWMAFDPLPVLDSFDPEAAGPADETDESLSSLVTNA